jgi:hypothetical protein
MKEKLGVIIALLIAYSGITFAADPQATITPKLADINTDTKECYGFSEDSLILKIRINNKEITQEFCSAYGIADAKIIKDTLGVNFLILKTAQGRGTHCTTEYLTIYRIENNLEELARFPVFEPAGRAANCYYDYKIKKPKDGGLLFLITVRIANVYPEAQDEEWLPIEKERTLLIK